MGSLQYENNLISQGKLRLAGMDEVGRGSLAGPVTVACVRLPLDDLIEGIDDSKKLTASKREKLFDIIMSKVIDYQVVHIDNRVIDRINILNATKLAMRQCVNQMNDIDSVLVDAIQLSDTIYPTYPIIGGDALSYLIGAASIVAKVIRDRIMVQYDEQYPQYGLASNKGYGTKQHMDAIRRLGASPIHRTTFITRL
ncbi:MAG: ribonuclease HII [Clostridia bacterium]|nr:ribonuclease HII [Clostridia bacterium]